MYPSSMHEQWERCNAIVLGWIMNTVSKSLVSTVIYGSDAHTVWEDLRERFDKVNASRAFYLHKEIVTLSQGTASVSNYFSRLRELWDEFETLISPPSCACPESKQYAEHFQFQKLWQFLMGLNESYAHAKSQVLMQIPTPNVNQAYAMIINVESQRVNGASSSSFSTETSSETALMSNRMSGYNSGYHNSGGSSSGSAYYPNNGSSGNSGYKARNNGDVRQGGRSNLYCDYCHYRGHTKDSCYKLHGYPKKKGSSSSHANSATAGGCQSPENGTCDNSSVNTNAKSFGTSSNNFSGGTQGLSLFTHEHYNQILKMLSKGKGKEVDSMANVATASSSCTFTALMSDMAHTKWIIDTGASNHMVHSMNLMKHCTDLGSRNDMKVNLLLVLKWLSVMLEIH